MYVTIIALLLVLAIFDLVVGVSNDAVNFLNSAIGSRVARYRTIVIIAAIGVFAGAALSNGMMDVARHGILTPAYFAFNDVICVFLAVMVTDVVLLDVFNSLGMPTSTTVSMVFELLGGAFAIALIKIAHGATDATGQLLGLGDLLNTEKALSVIVSIFLSVALAFLLGLFVQWVSRLVFTFTYGTGSDGQPQRNTSVALKTGIFAGIATTGIVWFLLIKGFKDSSFMTADLKALITSHTWTILGLGTLVFSVLMTLLSFLRVPVLKLVVLLGTFALAMAFAGNDLVNFVGVPLAGLDAYNDYTANGGGDATGYLMTSLMGSAQTPPLYLFLAGTVMVLALVFSKKAHRVVKTSVDLSRQDEGDEMFGSSRIARVLVRNSSRLSQQWSSWIPQRVNTWIDSRFNTEAMVLPEGAAFDQLRAAINLVVAGLLVAMGTSLKLPLSTTYVTFMVAMGSSLADRAWSRESAVFRITGVISVIGGWFVTAGVAFIVCFLMTSLMYFGGFVAMAIAIALVVLILIRSNMKFKQSKEVSATDQLFERMLRTTDVQERWQLLQQHVRETASQQLLSISSIYTRATEAFLTEEYRPFRRTTNDIDEQRKELKRQRRREIIGLRRIDPILAVERNTWFFLASNALSQMMYCLKRINEPCREHVGNNFSPVEAGYADAFRTKREEVTSLLERAIKLLQQEELPLEREAEEVRAEGSRLQSEFSSFRKKIIDDIQSHPLNIETMTVYLNMVQETQELLGTLRHLMRGMAKFSA